MSEIKFIYLIIFIPLSPLIRPASNSLEERANEINCSTTANRMNQAIASGSPKICRVSPNDHHIIHHNCVGKCINYRLSLYVLFLTFYYTINNFFFSSLKLLSRIKTGILLKNYNVYTNGEI